MYKDIVLIGAGAVGAYLIWGLSKREDVDLCVCADGKRKERYEKGFNINGEVYVPKVKEAWQIKNTDLLIVAVKYNALKDVLLDIKRLTGENTDILCLMNGIENERIIGDAIGEKHVLYSFIKIASERSGNTICFDPEKTIGMVYGEKDGTISKRVNRLNRLFEGTDLKYRASRHIVDEIWNKFRLNIAGNMVQAVLDIGVGAYEDSEHVKFLQKKLVEEFDKIADVKGINIDKSEGATSYGNLVKKSARYSTLQDLDAKRHTEIDMFCGAVVEMGNELGIPVQYNEFVYHAVKALEEKNDGKFDY